MNNAFKAQDDANSMNDWIKLQQTVKDPTNRLSPNTHKGCS